MKDKLTTQNIFRIQSNDHFMCGLYCIAFIEYIIAGKNFIDYTIYFFLMTIKRITRQNISTLNTNMAKENVSLDFWIKKKNR